MLLAGDGLQTINIATNPAAIGKCCAVTDLFAVLGAPAALFAGSAATGPRHFYRGLAKLVEAYDPKLYRPGGAPEDVGRVSPSPDKVWFGRGLYLSRHRHKL